MQRITLKIELTYFLIQSIVFLVRYEKLSVQIVAFKIINHYITPDIVLRVRKS